MSTTILTTKLYIPPPRPNLVRRSHLWTRLTEGLHRKLTLVSAPAGFGKTTLISSWIDGLQTTEAGQDLRTDRPSTFDYRVAWLSLDKQDSDPVRFLTYLVAALQRINPDLGSGLLDQLHAPLTPPVEPLLTTLLNRVTTLSRKLVVVLDDYQSVEDKAVDKILAFLLEHLPPQMHLVITTRADPQLPLARYRARGQLTELRAGDLRFTHAEAADFLERVTGVSLTEEEIAALEHRTEGWIAGLQMAALAMQGTLATQRQQDVSRFVRSFTGSHRFVMDYLVEEVLQQQPEAVRRFLLRTSILDRMCADLCDRVLGSGEQRSDKNPFAPMAHSSQSASSQSLLEMLERQNLFLIPLDNERRWYRYHHLFAELLRQRMQQSAASSEEVTDAHQRASQWFEENEYPVDAFQHAAAANDLSRAVRLIENRGMPLYFSGAVAPVLTWLRSLPSSTLDVHPYLWVIYAWSLWIAHQNPEVDEKLQRAESALQSVQANGWPYDDITTLQGQIASLRVMLASNKREADAIVDHAHRALTDLPESHVYVRTAVTRAMALAHQFQGERRAAAQAYAETISLCQASGNRFVEILATTGLGVVQEQETQLYPSAQTYRRVLDLVGNPPQPIACEALFGLARVLYQWNDLAAAQAHAEQSVALARSIAGMDRFVAAQIFLARLHLAREDVDAASTLLAEAAESMRIHGFAHQAADLAAAQVLLLLHQGDLAAADHLAHSHDLPISQARVCLAVGDAAGGAGGAGASAPAGRGTKVGGSAATGPDAAGGCPPGKRRDRAGRPFPGRSAGPGRPRRLHPSLCGRRNADCPSSGAGDRACHAARLHGSSAGGVPGRSQDPGRFLPCHWLACRTTADRAVERARGGGAATHRPGLLQSPDQ